MRIKLALLSMLLASCNSVPFLTPYKMDIRQGNFVTPEMREKLKLGMTRQQVRYVMGTPMINDVFHANRWDYAYRLEHGKKLIEKHKLTLYFEGDNLVRMVDDNQPLETTPTKSVNDKAEIKANEQQKDKK
jgi:outer membrane protein assembly factor BamE